MNSFWCLCLAVLLIGCALVLFTVTGGEKQLSAASPSSVAPGNFTVLEGTFFKETPSVTQQHMYPLMKLLFSSPSYRPLLSR